MAYEGIWPAVQGALNSTALTSERKTLDEIFKEYLESSKTSIIDSITNELKNKFVTIVANNAETVTVTKNFDMNGTSISTSSNDKRGSIWALIGTITVPEDFYEKTVCYAKINITIPDSISTSDEYKIYPTINKTATYNYSETNYVSIKETPKKVEISFSNVKAGDILRLYGYVYSGTSYRARTMNYGTATLEYEKITSDALKPLGIKSIQSGRFSSSLYNSGGSSRYKEIIIAPVNMRKSFVIVNSEDLFPPGETDTNEKWGFGSGILTSSTTLSVFITHGDLTGNSNESKDWNCSWQVIEFY